MLMSKRIFFYLLCHLVRTIFDPCPVPSSRSFSLYPPPKNKKRKITKLHFFIPTVLRAQRRYTPHRLVLVIVVVVFAPQFVVASSDLQPLCHLLRRVQNPIHRPCIKRKIKTIKYIQCIQRLN